MSDAERPQPELPQEGLSHQEVSPNANPLTPPVWDTHTDAEPITAQLVGDPRGDWPPPSVPVQWRLWTVFLTLIVAVFAMLFASVVVAIPFMIPVLMEQSGRADPEALTAAVSSPWAFFAQGFAGQAGLAIVALFAAYLSPVPMRERIGLVDSGLTGGQWLAVGFSSLAPAAIGIALAQLLALVIAPDETALKLFSGMPVMMIVPWVLFIALAPGFTEEILFRGYVQTRLLKRWSPWLAILVSSALFAAIHFMPHTVVFAFPIGIWFRLCGLENRFDLADHLGSCADQRVMERAQHFQVSAGLFR
jgi:uncharacterized protein